MGDPNTTENMQARSNALIAVMKKQIGVLERLIDAERRSTLKFGNDQPALPSVVSMVIHGPFPDRDVWKTTSEMLQMLIAGTGSESKGQGKFSEEQHTLLTELLLIEGEKVKLARAR